MFEEATTYTALQFFSRHPNDEVQIAFVPNGVVPEEPWAGNDSALTYQQLTFGERWLMTTGADRNLMDGLYERCKQLDDPAITQNIFVGIQTSADQIYHLRKLGPGRYECEPKGKDAPPPYEVRIEDDLMKPLVSGAEAKRYVEPKTTTYLLFPYTVHNSQATLISAIQMAADYPLAWAYLRSWAEELKARENGLFDDNEWYRFGRHQNLDKQEIEKLIVPRLVTTVSCSVDEAGEVYLDNVDVGGVSAARGVSLYWLAGILNCKACGFVFRRVSKPFRGDFRSANKQFIAPLPIPIADDGSMQSVADSAKRLQALHTQRRDLLDDINRRLGVVQKRSRPEIWLFPELTPKRDLQDEAPARLEAAQKREWAARKFQQALDGRLTELGERIRPGVNLDADFNNGELRFIIDGMTMIEQIFLEDAEGQFILAQWKLLASTFNVTETTDGKKLANALRKIGQSDNPELIRQIIDLQRKLTQIENEIERDEVTINRLCYDLYGLQENEIRLIEAE